MATWYMFTFQDSNSPYADHLISFHNFSMMIMLMITMMTLYFLFSSISSKFINRNMINCHELEMIWTIFPMIILITICFPSLKILYLLDEIWNPMLLTIKSIGHQWYWSYEYPDFNELEFDSYMNKELTFNSFRLLDVDNRMIIPHSIPIRLLTTSTDVIHSWAMPSMGLKMDSTPGRINQLNIYSMRPGLYFGQCSEICGANHSFMPIVIEVTSYKNFINWIMNM